ncbi:MAG TPA: DUF6443 domain-containing protein, partial [Cytophagales bacterium]
EYCEGDVVTLSGKNTSSYYWQGPTGNSGATTFNATTSGTYKLTGTNPCGISQAATITLTFKPNVSGLTLSPAGVSFCQGSQATTSFTASASNATAFSWSVTPTGNEIAPGSQNTSGSTLTQGAVVTWASTFSGTATVTVTAYGCGGSSATTSQTVTILPRPTATITPSGSTTIPFGVDNKVLQANTGTGLSYQWFRDGVAIPAATTSSHGATLAGSYTVRVTGTNGCSTTSPATVVSHENNYNYIITRTLLTGQKTDGNPVNAGDIPVLTTDECQVSIAYFDGLGRPMQTVTKQGSPSKQDLVQPIEYDTYGRQQWQYLPYTAGSFGFFKTTATRTNINDPATYTSSSQYLFHQNPAASGDGRAADTAPRAETELEDSPLGRVLEQGALGSAWQIVRDLNQNSTGAGKTLKRNLRGNQQTSTTTFGQDNVRQFVYTPTASTTDPTAFGTVSTNGLYAAGELLVTETTDEHGAEVIEFRDREGRLIRKKVQEIKDDPATTANEATFASTCYVYDDLGQLRLVISPEGLTKLTTVAATFTDQVIDDYCFRYRYDARGRLIEKKAPGAGPVYLVYNKRDELVMTQDGRQRPGREWNFTKYDALGRVVMTGLYTHATVIDQKAMQDLANAVSTQFESRSTDVANYATHQGYTNAAFPSSGINRLTVNYYDHYDLDNNGTAEAAFDGTGDDGMIATVTAGTVTRGKLTAGKVKVLPAGNWLTTATFYDAEGRVVQTWGDNHVGGRETATSVLDFTGKTLQTKSVHTTTLAGASTLTVLKRNTYDHGGRLLRTTQTTNGGTEEEIGQYSYNELGQ